MEKKLRIGVDVDDVVLTFVDTFLEDCERLSPPVRMINGMKGYISEGFGLNRKEFREIHTKFAPSDYHDNMPIIEGFAEIFPILNSRYSLFLVTSRSPLRKQRTLNCLQRQVPDFKLPIYFSEEFYEGNITKEELCEKLEIGTHIDDNTDYPLSCLEKGVRVLLFNQPGNQNYPVEERVVRVAGWKDVLKQLNFLETLNEY